MTDVVQALRAAKSGGAVHLSKRFGVVEEYKGGTGMEWRIGCSGYHYPEWKGVFYPEALSQRRWFEYYCAHFDTLELNITYYKFPRVETLRTWYGRSPGRFSFTIKAPRHITHFKKFRDVSRMLSDFYGAARAGLREKLGCVLFQFPSAFHFEPARLNGIVTMLDKSFNNVLEFRHESWWNAEVFETLEKSRISFCGMSHPELPDVLIDTARVLYYRLHGIPGLYTSQYDVSALAKLRQDILNRSRVERVYVYFNNTAEGHAVTNAKQLQSLCELVLR